MHPKKILPFVVVGVVAVIIGSYWWHVSYQTKLADQRLEAMADKLAEMDSLAFDINLDLEMSGEEGVESTEAASENAHIKLVFSGVQDTKDINNPRAMMTITGTLEGVLGSEVGSGTVKLETRVIGEVVYIKLVNAPDIEFFDLKPFIGTWIRIDPNALLAQLGLTAEDVAAAQEQNKISEEQTERLRKIWREAKVLKVVSVKSGETIDGVDTYHYVFEIQKPQLIAYVKKVSEELSQDVPAEDIATMEKNIADFELPQGELWIGKNDLYPRKVHVAHQVEATPETPVNVSFTLNILLKDINKPVSVMEPIGAKSIEEVIGEIFGAMQDTAMSDDARGGADDSFPLSGGSAYDPAYQFARARDTQRKANVNAILNSIGLSMEDNLGVFDCSAGPLPRTPRVISSSDYDLMPCIVPIYISMPLADPNKPSIKQNATIYDSGYTIFQDAVGRITIAAPLAELESVSVTH